MADNITIPLTGSGDSTAIVATDDAGAAGEVQIIKLAISTDGSATAIPADATNGLDVDVTRLSALVAGTAVIGKVGIDQTTPGTTNLVALAANQSVNVAQFSGTTAVNGSGNATGALRVELPTNGTGVLATVGAVTAITNALPAGTNAIGKLATNSGVDIGDVDVTSISAGSNLVGDVGIQPRTTNGLDTFMASGSDGSSILVATAQAAKASAGKVYGYYAYNPEAAVTFVHFYNTASGSVTVGTTNPLFTIQIPPASAANLMNDIGITFGTAITVAATTTAGGNTAPATGVSLTIWYK